MRSVFSMKPAFEPAKIHSKTRMKPTKEQSTPTMAGTRFLTSKIIGSIMKRKQNTKKTQKIATAPGLEERKNKKNRHRRKQELET